MKVLFVCHGNVGRSQVAQVHFDQISQHESLCAGTGVDENIATRNLQGRKLKDLPLQRSVDYIQKEFGVDLSERERKQLTPEMIDETDKIIVINEKENWPDYLIEGGKVVFWDIQDARGRDEALAHQVYSQVRQRVDELVREIG